ncbi:hypothetical protein FB45DRAFT_1117742 [Roridomyces roridus]|uniref:Uncharacterized protein n=1 Tax=Roridomyces roridus TaxID=1738132 RepID=A0AAD7B6B5_9AGAR|nr:hypothetical protein FB45DRAFT_1117742 [Roridomyces roridus]
MPVSFTTAPHAANSFKVTESFSAAELLSGACEDQKRYVEEIFQCGFSTGEQVLSSGRDFNAKIPNLRPDSEGNGFVHTVMEAYNHHRALVIRPDDLWLAILSQFNFFVNANAEVLRANFVAHEGQRKLLVEASGDRYSVDFDTMSRQVTTLLHENAVDPALRDWEYFRVGFGLPWCGIPRVTLEGEKSDWVNILERLEKLKEYGVETIAWYHLLRPVISRFVAAFDKPTSQENTDFWQKIVSVDTSSPSKVVGWESHSTW